MKKVDQQRMDKWTYGLQIVQSLSRLKSLAVYVVTEKLLQGKNIYYQFCSVMTSSGYNPQLTCYSLSVQIEGWILRSTGGFIF